MRTRFAPSPTGPLHLGHAFSALTAWHVAEKAGGEFLLRIEDTDQSRARPEWEAQIYQDLRWLGLSWPRPVLRQSTHFPRYHAAMRCLHDQGLLYPCTCKRRDIEAAMSAPQEGDDRRFGPDGLIYPGTCRANAENIAFDQLITAPAIRLNLRAGFERLTCDHLHYTEFGQAPGDKTLAAETAFARIGDVVLGRQGTGTSYHLAVVVDDAFQEITDAVRGADLSEATFIHVLLQQLLNLPQPRYHHHRLIRDAHGKRLAKRHDAKAIARYRAEGMCPKEVIALAMGTG